MITLYRNPLLGWQLWRGRKLLRHAMESSVRLWSSTGLVRRVGRDTLVVEMKGQQ